MPIILDFNLCQGHVEQPNAYLTCVPSLPLRNWVQSFWQLSVPKGKYYYRSVPDNCVDLIVNANCSQDIYIVAPFSSSIVFELEGPAIYFGIRFQVLGHSGIITTPLGEWGGAGVMQASELLPSHILDSIYERLSGTLKFELRCQNLATYLLSISVDHYQGIDLRLARYVRFCNELVASRICISDQQCAEFGLSSRQLRRLSQHYMGLSPRELARVFRFQSMLNRMNVSNDMEAWADHYHDQPHFIREFKRLSGVTPTQLRDLSVLYNKD